MKNKFIRNLSIILCLLVILSIRPAQAQKNLAERQPDAYVQIKLDGKLIETDVRPFVLDGRTLVPIRFISESLGQEVNWDQNSREVKITGNDKVITMYPENGKILINDKEVKTDMVPFIKDSRTFVPLRFVGEEMGVKVDWDNYTKTVILSSKGDVQEDKKTGKKLRYMESDSKGGVLGLINPGAYIQKIEGGSAKTSKVFPGKKVAEIRDSRLVIETPKDEIVPEGMKRVEEEILTTMGKFNEYSLYDSPKIDSFQIPGYVPNRVKTPGGLLNIDSKDIKFVGNLFDLGLKGLSENTQVLRYDKEKKYYYQDNIDEDILKEIRASEDFNFTNPIDIPIYKVGYNIPSNILGVSYINNGDTTIVIGAPIMMVDGMADYHGYNQSRFIVLEDGTVVLCDGFTFGITDDLRKAINDPNYKLAGKTIKYIIHIDKSEKDGWFGFISDVDIEVPDISDLY